MTRHDDFRAPQRTDRGFTLIELVAVMSIFGIIATFAIGGWTAWSRSHGPKQAVTEIQGTLREAQQRAVTRGTTLCVLFDLDDDTWRLYEGKCTSTTKTELPSRWDVDDEDVHIDTASFLQADGTYLPGVSFSPRGTATPGDLVIVRESSDRSITVSVEGLTGRVSYE